MPSEPMSPQRNGASKDATGNSAPGGISTAIPGMAETFQLIKDKVSAAGSGSILKRHSGAADIVFVRHGGGGRVVADESEESKQMPSKGNSCIIAAISTFM
ncbi:hypothetical protein GUITHDRAFT_114103 [Guillardia theta CCMP2712]|uniref:Uncharacterized protein n=1 Tax=Guillardia theta (strain CCMP2712) TaxID=905079 RepID=L1IUF8_GUITC|nr:hypothetical protein GUITHDRAFT_114103 [Guillardia theta CCMP2712]EKX39853.1 hypothetical protein GUITHDRAFT_114103 [Guillardia theta CCMP2712]|eukprot:XP_005826833.1 hypothetical protein GUITHDRAFT_114103 [Guillardia theta CCMP2712]